MSKSYHYQSLDHGLSQIRIFSLLPASDHDTPLRGQLRIEQFSPTVPVYEAISYVWGAKQGEGPLEVDKKKLMITCNLASVLKRVRYKDRIRYLWIDAVCIDQSSPEEKSQQVRKMHRIYSSASRVLIWLGEEDPNDAIAFVMNYLERLQKQGLEHCKDDAMYIETATGALFKCSWWERVWTIQEGAVANEESLVLWGSRVISWVFLINLVEHVNSSYQPLGPTDSWNHPVSELVRVYRHYHVSRTIPLEDLIYVSCDRYASDPRDLIYALLGLVKRQFFEPFEPDYSQSTTWAFQRATVSVIKAREDLDFLLNIVLAHSMVEGIERSSWAYDFAKRPVWLSSNVKDYLRRRYHIMHEGASTGRRYCGIQHDAEAKTIKLTGTIVGPVAESQMLYTDCYSTLAEKKGWVVLSLWHPYVDPFVPWLLQTVQEFTVMAQRAWSRRFPLDTVKGRINKGDVWRIAMDGITMDDLKRMESPPRPEAPVDEWEDLQRCSALDDWRNMLSQETSGLEEDVECNIAKSFYRIIVGVFSTYEHWKGCLFTTTNGYVASADKEVQSGDVVCIMFGCAMPLVLRPQNDGTYVIVDVACVEGIMEGEFLQDKARYTVAEFIIS